MNGIERVIAVQNETSAHTSRMTRDGRTLTYRLKVLQQPERARACGSGAKSSADRRPVDPPPIVELKIFEGENEEKDVTFQLSANYFLFATLEQARPIAQGRVPQAENNRATVLTGTPVAGMVYLDRPEPAGYFIFPDLSVRHEGKYRLGFSLYEELKNMEDGDRIDGNGSKAQGVGEACVTHRLEVRSIPFLVYSAKKFPGLASSTSLSRTVAEQGCRVRIRRDVRMRRRDTKPGKDGYDGYSDGGFDRTRHSTTPDMYQPHGMQPGRERSASITTPISLVGGPDSRRTSLQEMAHTYPQPGYPAPPVSQNPQSASIPQPQYRQSMQQPQHQQHHQQQQQQQQQPPPPPQQQQQQQHYAPPHYPYQQQAPMPPPQMSYQGYQYGQPAAPVSQQSYHYPQPAQAAPVPPYDAHSHARNPSVDYAAPAGTDSRRSSTMIPSPMYQYGAQSHAGQTQYAPQQNGYNMPSTSREAAHGPPPAMHHPAALAPPILPPINTSMQARDKLEPSTPTSATVTTSHSHNYYGGSIGQAAPEVISHAGAKRGYDRVFNTEHMNAPLRQGARPSSPYVHADHGHDDGVIKMSYRRADGREIARPLPPSI